MADVPDRGSSLLATGQNGGSVTCRHPGQPHLPSQRTRVRPRLCPRVLLRRPHTVEVLPSCLEGTRSQRREQHPQSGGE